MSTVLIVDDEKGIRAGLSNAITRGGHRAVVAASLSEARARLSEALVFDCALVDIRLKDGSGLELLREIRAGRHRDVPSSSRPRTTTASARSKRCATGRSTT